MKEINVYIQIQELKEKGFKKDAVAKQLCINWRTVNRYWDMNPDDYKSNHENIDRIHILDKYKDIIVLWLKDYPGLSAAQVTDWLKENYGESFSQRTVSRYVRSLRRSLNLPKKDNPREYAAVADLPMGKQVQVDFGEKYLSRASGGNIKVFVAAYVFANSRYKYAETQSRPFTSTDLVRITENFFNHIGGIPQELVFDQDSIVCVSENAGDIIYTYEFEKFRQECKFNVYMCRGADPESKGKVENCVKYIKGNFLSNRIYVDDETLNKSCSDWLKRTANAKEHGTTKKIPAEVFEEERKHLRPLKEFSPVIPERITRNVRKDNTILFNSNRYSLPLGTQTNNPEVKIEINDGLLLIYTVKGEKICEHRLCSGRGQLVQNSNHLRNTDASLDGMLKKMVQVYGTKTADFFSALRHEKSRYFRDQCSIIDALEKEYEICDITKAICFCTESHLYSANIVKEYVLSNSKPKTLAAVIESKIPVDDVKYHITTQKRDLQEYAKVGEAV